MKNPLHNGVIRRTLVCLVLGFVAVTARAQYSIDWFTVDGGGGSSTGGVYSVSGTIGQPDAGVMSGGDFTLQGGFWAIVAAVQTPGSPLLSVARTSTNTVLVSWPYPSSGFALEQSTTIEGTAWVGTTNVPMQKGSNWEIIVAPPANNRFYRLKR